MEKALLHDVAQYYKFDVLEAEIEYQKYLVGALGGASSEAVERPEKESSPKSNLAKEIEKAREKIKSLNTTSGVTPVAAVASVDVEALEQSNRKLVSMVDALILRVSALETTVSSLQKGAAEPAKPVEAAPVNENGEEKAVVDEDDDDDDDEDIFGESEEESEGEAERKRLERVKAYEARKQKKPVVIAKSNIVLDVKPWGDDTDMSEMERQVRGVEMDGLLWGSAKLVPVGYGIKKLQIACVVEDDKVGTEDLEERITAFEDLVQSVDVAAFNKI